MLVLILLAITSAAAFWYDRFLCPREERWAWRHNLASTIISVALGVVTAIAIFQYQAHEQDSERKSRLRTQLSQELSATYRDLYGPPSSGLNVAGEYLQTRPSIIQIVAVDDAVRSGLFGVDESKLLTTLSLAERSYNAKLYHYMAFLVATAGSETNAKNAVTNLESERLRVLSLLRKVQEQLRVSLDANG